MARRHLTLLTLLAGTGLTGTAAADPSSMVDERLQPGLYPAAPVPEAFAPPSEPGHPPFDLDWSVGLKGSYTEGTGGDSFVSTLNPRFTATHEGVRADIVVDGNAEIARTWDRSDEIEIPALRLGVSVTAPIDSVTTLDADAALELNRDLRSDPGVDALVVVPPEVLTGSAGLGVERSFGRFNLTLRGEAERTIYGETTRLDTGVTDNSDQDLWELDTSLRLGFRATPIFEVFTQASLGRDLFDHPSDLGLTENATDVALRGGIAGSWNGVLAASASAGYGYHNFDEAALGDVATQLYDASISFTPDPTLSLAARLETSIDPAGADASGTARISHSATADLSYLVNSRMRLRASADWGRWEMTDSTETEYWYGAGAGADYKINSRLSLSADYGFDSRDNSDTGERDSHTVSLGVTMRR